ncbi:MAG: glycosyltransferase family 1 protein [Arenicellales bacterium]
MQSQAVIVMWQPNHDMKLIFAVDAVFPPLTGIGRYTWELGRRLEANPEIADIRFFSMGRRIRRLGDQENMFAKGGVKAGPRRRISVGMRQRLSKQVWAVRGYNAVIPRWTQYRLRTLEEYVYHSPSFFVPRFKGRSIATIHDLSNYKYAEMHPRARRKMFELNMTQTLAQVSHMITVSEAMRREIIEYFGWPETKISTVHLGVDPIFRPRLEKELQSTLNRYSLAPGMYALCVSTLEPRKRIESLLTAYAILPAQLRGRYPLVLSGDSGWLSESLHAQLDEARRAGWVRWLGFVPEEDLPFLYAGARVFCYPSVYEGFGLPVLEAMASGVPVLASDKSSLPEVTDGAALLVDPDDVEAMSEGVHRVLEDTAWRTQSMERGLAVASNKTWEHCTGRTIEVYRRVVSE